jgi:glycosyltransferase involved in cell wall biosynthesis
MAASDFLILGIGRLVQQKRPFHFLSIAKELYERVPNVRFLWVGDGPLVGEWRRQIARQQLDTIITCVGWQADVLPFLVAGDLLLHVAEYEGLPFAVIEAMAAGLPCVVTRDLSCEIPLFNDQNVLFVDDLENLANKVRSPSDLCSVIQNAYRLVQNELSLKTMTDSYEQLYLDAISHGSTSSDLSTADIASTK